MADMLGEEDEDIPGGLASFLLRPHVSFLGSCRRRASVESGEAERACQRHITGDARVTIPIPFAP